ncbi:MAG: T9SS type A sorting domain-containing protein [Flavobacteriales bacterium]|nr:T9SS type A sorting domain-containing protein [Flavobacteriales bacterium]
MKKIYTVAGAAFFLANIAFAQRTNIAPAEVRPGAQNEVSTNVAHSLNAGIDALGDTIWSEDFSGGIPAGWEIIDHTTPATGNVWEYASTDTISCILTSAIFKATSAKNGYALMFGDRYNADAGCLNNLGVTLMNTSLQTPAMDYTGYTSVFLKFQHAFRYCCDPASKLSIYVSNDSTSWKEYNVKGTYPVSTGVKVNDNSPNPMMASVNISDIASGQSKVWIRWRIDGPSHYYWAVDDVAVVEGYTEENALVRPFVDFNYMDGGFYSMLPRSQGATTPIDFRGAIYNNGTSALANVVLNVKVKDPSGATVYDESSTAMSTVPLDLDTVSTSTSFYPGSTCNEIGQYSIDYTVNQTETDQYMANNTASFNFALSDTVFARDYGVANKAIGLTTWASCSQNADGEEISTLYEFSSDAVATSISFYNMASTTPGVAVILNLYRFQVDGNGAIVQTSPIAASEIYDIVAGDANSWITLPFTTPVTVEKDSAFMASISIYNIAGKSFWVGGDLATIQPDATSFAYCSGGWGWVSDQPMIRLNVNDGSGNYCVGVNEVENPHKVKVFPNPNNGYFNIIAENLRGRNSTIQVTNVIGQVVYSKDVCVSTSYLSETIDLSSIEKGLYFVKLINNNSESVYKVVVE